MYSLHSNKFCLLCYKRVRCRRYTDVVSISTLVSPSHSLHPKYTKGVGGGAGPDGIPNGFSSNFARYLHGSATIDIFLVFKLKNSVSQASSLMYTRLKGIPASKPISIKSTMNIISLPNANSASNLYYLRFVL